MNLELVNDISPLSLQSKIEDAQRIFSESNLHYIPVIDNENYLGCIADYVVDGIEGDTEIRDFVMDLSNFYGKEDMNEQEVFEIMGRHRTNILPILSQNKGDYLGYLELKHLLAYFSNMPFMNEHGNFIVVQKAQSEHSFSEVSQIVESNNTKLLSLYISSFENDMIQTTIKMGDGDFNAIAQTFRRYGYDIISDHYDDVFLNNLKERSRYFDRYLNI